MPTYEYICKGCNEEFETAHSMNAEPPPCPHCNTPGPKRLISKKTSFALKGSGWYKDSYSGPSNRGEST